jgi:hypothetical protein
MRIELNGKFYRMRRGRLVKIPAVWLNNVTTPATIRRRFSKMTGKLAKLLKHGGYRLSLHQREAALDDKLALLELAGSEDARHVH